MTVKRIIAPLFLALIALAACGKKKDGEIAAPSGPVAAVAPPAGTEWADAISKTADGGYLMGNPAAPVKFVEYASLACPHCKAFNDEAGETLKSEFVKTGKVSWEFRSTIIHGALDVAPSLLIQCQGPSPYFKLAEQLYQTQDEWSGKYFAQPKDVLEREQSLPPTQQFADATKATGLDAFFRQRGLPQAKIDACLNDSKALADLMALQNKSQADGVTGTPTFFVNGVKLEGVEWKELEAKLRAATGS